MLPLACAAPALRAGEAALPVENEAVCRINTETLSIRDIETRMMNSGREMLDLFLFRERLKAEGTWDREYQERFDEIHRPAFRDELRRAIRERLTLQEARRDGFSVEGRTFEHRLARLVEDCRKQGLLSRNVVTLETLQRELQERMLLEDHEARSLSVLDRPRRPDVQRYYEAHKTEFLRGPAVKLKRVRIALRKIDALGREVIVANAQERAEEAQRRVAEGELGFAEAVRQFSNDPEETREQAGLLRSADGDLFVELDKLPAEIRQALRGLNEHGLSKVFSCGDGSFAFVKLEARRGPEARPLDEQLYHEIEQRLLREILRRKDEEWLRKALRENLVVLIEGGQERPLPAEFFGQPLAQLKNK